MFSDAHCPRNFQLPLIAETDSSSKGPERNHWGKRKRKIEPLPGGFIDFVSKHPVTRPIQNSREFVVAHSGESSRSAPLRKPALLLGLYEFLLRALFTWVH